MSLHLPGLSPGLCGAGLAGRFCAICYIIPKVKGTASLIPTDVRRTVVDANGNGIGLYFIMRDAQADDAGFGVEWTLLVEDEVADAVEDGFAAIGFRGLKGVCVVTDDDIGAGIDKRMSLQPLLGQRAQRMLGSPVQINDDNCDGIGHFDGFHSVEQRVKWLLADALTVGQVSEALQGKTVGGEEINGTLETLLQKTLPPAPPCMEGSR